MKKILYLARHGETIFNVERKIQGWCDSPLTRNGIKQAEGLNAFFTNNHIDFDAVYSSSSERAYDTANIICGGKYDITRLKDLREMSFGTLEGNSGHLSLSDVTLKEDFLVQYHGESRTAAQLRMFNCLNSLLDNTNVHTLLVVGSSCSITNFLQYVDKDGFDEIIKNNSFKNCCTLKFEYEDKKYKLVDLISPT